MAIWFSRHRGGMTLEQVRAEMGAPSYASVAMQVGRWQRQIPQNAQLLQIEYNLEKATEHLDAFSECLDGLAQTDNWFWDSLENLHSRAKEIVRCHLASLNKVDAC